MRFGFTFTATVPHAFALLAAALVLGPPHVHHWLARGRVPRRAVECAANFSASYADALGLDPREAFSDVVADLGIRLLRLSVPWDETEPEPGSVCWDQVDWQMDAAAAAGAAVLLAVGHKTPRFPEYHAPSWAVGLEERPFRQALMSHVAAAVRRYKDHPALEAWQVENEPLAGFAGWRFGAGCRDVTRWLAEEIRLVRALDPAHPVLVSFADVPWIFSQLRGTLRFDSDIVGISLYGRVYFRSPFYTGYLDQDRFGLLAPLSLEYQEAVARGRGRELWVTELQAEPWSSDPRGLPAADPADLACTMSPELLARSWERVTRAGISRAYLWGVEWILFQRERGLDEGMIDLVRGFAGAGGSAAGGS